VSLRCFVLALVALSTHHSNPCGYAIRFSPASRGVCLMPPIHRESHRCPAKGQGKIPLPSKAEGGREQHSMYRTQIRCGRAGDCGRLPARNAEDPERQPEGSKPKLVTKRCRLDMGRSSEWLQSPKPPPGRKSGRTSVSCRSAGLETQSAIPGAGRIGKVMAAECWRAVQKTLEGSQSRNL
jgi:hypothetical protein